MKKKVLFIVAFFLLFVQVAKAEEINVYKITTDIEDGKILYGDNYPFSAQSEEFQKYSITGTLCPDSNDYNPEKDCYNTEDGKFPELKPGKYKVGFAAHLTPGNTRGDAKWIVNGEEMNPVECGGDESSVGCEKFFTVELKDWEYKITGVKVDNVTTNFKVGDTPKFTGTISEEDSKYYKIVEGWCNSEDAIFDQEEGVCTFSNGNKMGEGISSFEDGKKYYYVISFFTNKESYVLMSQSPTINGKKYDLENISGLGDYSFGEWILFSIEIAPEVKLDNTNSKEDAKVTEDVINNALESLVQKEEVKGVTKEVAEEIKKAINDGKTITSSLESESKKEKEVKEETKKLVAEKKEENQKVLGYFDVSIIIKANNEILGNVTELPKTITIVLDTKELIKNLPELAKGRKRIFSVLRIHGDIVDKLPATLNDDQTISTDTDKFSDYIVVYEDVIDETTLNNPKTGDNANIYLLILTTSLIGLVFVKKFN